MKKVITTIGLMMVIVMTLCYVTPIDAQTDNNIVINANGTITPSTAPIQQNGDTYTLTGSYEGTLLIQRSNIVFNGEGNFIQSPNKVIFCVKLDSVSNVTVKNLVVKGALYGCMYGIELVSTSYCLITNNTIKDVWSILALNAISFEGIHVNGGNSNVFTKNVLMNNLQGMQFTDTVNNLIVENSIDYTPQSVYGIPSGINFYQSSGNLIYHNTFKAEGTQARSYASNNTWDNGFPSGGNYWSDYGAGGSNFTKINGTEIYDSPYLINDVNIDHYPLAEPYTATTPEISILSMSGDYNVSSVPLNFNVDQPTVWMGYSLDGSSNVTLTGNETLTDISNGQHTVTVYANNSFGDTGSAEFEFTVSAPMSVVVVLILSVVVVGLLVVVGLVYYRWHKKKAVST